MQEYLELVRYVLENGAKKTDRTGTGTLSLFGLKPGMIYGRVSPY